MLETLRNLVSKRPTERGAPDALIRANDPLAVALRTLQPDRGVGTEWQSPVYGEYYARSVDVYAAVKLRAEAAARPPLTVQHRDSQGALRPAGAVDPLQVLLDRGNPWYSRTSIMVATETYLSLWGAAFWFLGHSERSNGTPDELWPLRPDRVRVVRDAKRYVSGFVYSEAGQEFPMLTEEVVWFRYFNPLEEFAGFSPMAAGRLTADMGIDALRFNRELERLSRQQWGRISPTLPLVHRAQRRRRNRGERLEPRDEERGHRCPPQDRSRRFRAFRACTVADAHRVACHRR